MTFILALASIAVATPDAEITSYELSGDVSAMAVGGATESGDATSRAIFLDSFGEVYLMDGDTWAISSHPSPCETTNDVAIWEGSQSLVFMACGDGTVGWLELSESGSLTSTADNTFEISESSIERLVVDETCVWSASQENSQVSVSCFDPEVFEVGAGPYTTGRSGINHLAQTDSHLVVLHGGDDLTKLDKGSGTGATNEDNLSGRDFIDAASDGSNALFLIDDGGAVVKYRLTTNDYQVVLNESDDLEALSSIAMEVESEDSWLAISESQLHEVRFYSFDPATGTVSDALLDSIEASGVVAMERLDEKTLLVGQANGLVTVISSGLWVEVTDYSSEVLVAGDEVELTFVSDTSASYEVRADSMTGELFAEGDAVEGEETSVTFDIDSTFVEGSRRFFVIVEAEDRDGHDAFDITIDNPPSRVEVEDGNLKFGEESLVLSFQGIDDEDLDHYIVYVSDTLFVSDEWSSVSATGDTYELSGYGSGELVEWTLSSLVNGQPYYVAVSAVDSAGTEGPMSEVLTATPSEVVGAAELAGDNGGFFGCGTTGETGGAALAFVGLLSIFSRRRAAAMILLVGLVVSPGALGGTDETGSIEVSYGTLSLEDASIGAVYGGEISTLNLERTWRLHRMVEIGLNTGYGRTTAWALSGEDEESQSGYGSRFTVTPIGASVSLALDIIDGQPLVPWGEVSAEYWLWGERIDSGEGYLAGESFSGGKPTYSYSYGVNLLLDTISPARASLAQARWAIVDTYLTVEFQRTEMMSSESEGLDFSNNVVLFGLKVDR